MGEENILYVPNLLTSLEAKERHNKIALNYFNRTPTIGNIYNGVINWLKGHNVLEAEGTGLLTGTVIVPGIGNPAKTASSTLKVAKTLRTLEDYLKTTRVSAPKLEGTSALRSSYATDRFLGGLIFENSLPEEAMKVQGHGMAKSATIQDALARLRYMLDNGFEKGKTFFTAPLKVSDTKIGSALGTGGGKPYFDGHFLITGKPGLIINSIDDIGTIYINDAYLNEEALKAALKLQQYLLNAYPKINFKLYSLGFKQGGKMNILQFLKNGSGIHIKKENKGKFTDYCGGKVTSECIAKGKRSSNPAIRKRATFAANARKWKHEDGGRVKKHLAFVNGVSILDSNPDAYKYVKRKLHKAVDGGNSKNWFSGVGNWLNKNSGTISNIGNTAISTIANSVSAVLNLNNIKKLNKVNLEVAKALDKKRKAQYKPYAYLLALLLALLQTSGTEENISPIVIDLLAEKIADMLANSESSINQVLALNALMESAASNNMLENIMGGIGNGISTGIEMLGNKLSNNTSSTKTTSTTTSSTSTPIYLPSYKYDMMAPYKKDFTFKI